MKTDNIIAIKTKLFAIRIIRLYQHLQKKNKGAIEVLFRQLLRCGTSIGANVHEGVRAQSKKDFESKMNIALKEASETDFWLEIFMETDYLTKDEYESIDGDCIEIIKILTAILNASKKSK
ncbi:MAG: four helix bundle protein [Bacteroidia bacterium]|nr:four helix bundle protein [Bacteroidia bacterium]